MTATRLLEIAPARGDVAAAWALVRTIRAEDGAEILALATTAIGFLCPALTPDDGPASDQENRP